MLAPLALLPLLSLMLPQASADTRPGSLPHNLHHPYRRSLKRSITSDASSINGESFDFVIAGGGVAGLTLAARLSEWSNVTVLCIEAGGDGSNYEDQIDIPGYSYLNSLTGTAYDWAYNTVPQTDALDLTKYWPRGKGLGGSGAINGLFWGRASSIEYDAWATLNPNGNETWNWEEVNKYIKKSENLTAPPTDIQEKFGIVVNASAHGDDGPIQIGFSEYIFDEVAKWIPTWETLGLSGKDLAGGSTHGAMISTSTINMRNQTRSDSKAGYIDPLPPRSNLVILTEQQVTGVIFNGSTDASGNIVASGVTFQANSNSANYSVQANKEVLLAGGTVGSPQILQLSGIGPKDLLSSLGIDTKIDLPVGYNLQDHVSYSMYWSTPQGTLTWSNLSASSTLQSEQLAQYKSNFTGMWTYVNEAVGYPSMSDIMQSSSSASTYASTVSSAIDGMVTNVTSWLDLPDTVATGLTSQYQIQQQWLTEDIGQLEIVLTLLGNGGNELGIQVALQHPFSRGTIFINSTDPFTQPNINPDYFGVGYDIDIMAYGSEFARRLAAASPLSDVMITETAPGSSVTGDSLATYTKQNCGTEYHPLGTCSMLPKNSGGVVDTTLTVYGTSNLRVIDTSIAPLQLSAHLMATTYGIAEKGADIIKKKYWYVDPVTSSSATVAAATTSTEATTAAVGDATDTAVTNINQNNAESGSTLSSGAKIGIGVGVGVGAAAVLAGLLLFFVMRKRNQKEDEKGWYGDRQEGWNPDAGDAYKEPGSAYPMADFDSHNSYASPTPAFIGNHSRNQSINTIATADLASRTPMRNSSSFSYAAGGPGVGRTASPYRDDMSDDGNGQGHVYQAPEAPAGQQATRGEQRYQPVNIR
ncbi:hypothetical protein CNBM0790 [Cryptococcus deneoformans B-3501A]|uniref:Glucose-methanol-choline oxidoreductase N-terminal domain-containing protein n=1 Tax=Cryptococcus deneoformans (strain JEC21 / ATCC MYA-565) TaxID=214684 RepID=Q5K7Y0_CRYD1|nr:conserved hypothetical protein [Cryptococcus neoformans var. neoformans JEC21]XP_772159.1 hypothetical protein CNBM0790 [Cryptococcus neoformans var. neoformans B-3501A]AAW46800.1 conserved hypothetical protein [Cryptococcus neoformans var. neoformans JEC21]EAL17512.1 hypothetical protein CNBM0790 [Cryptococcus neoformans var. neoformans B-3501A]